MLPPAGSTPQKLHDTLVAAYGSDLGESFYYWISVDYPAWAREQARDGAAFRAWCASNNGKPPTG